jgi:hypothetical protein
MYPLHGLYPPYRIQEGLFRRAGTLLRMSPLIRAERMSPSIPTEGVLYAGGRAGLYAGFGDLTLVQAVP